MKTRVTDMSGDLETESSGRLFKSSLLSLSVLTAIFQVNLG